MAYKVIISKTARNSMRETPSQFDLQKEVFKDLEGVKNFLKENYGDNWSRGKPIYVDTKKGTKRVGVIKGYWNRDVSHNSNKWFQQDWISINKYSEERVDFNKVLNKLKRI